MTLAHPSPRPLFVVLEGIDGSGTTTQLEHLIHHLGRRGRAAAGTREPSAGPIGKLVREILLGRHSAADGTVVDGRAMALLFAADRRDHLAREVEPALSAGTDVVSDRYVLSSVAYQAVEAERAWVETLAEGIRVPDLTLLLDVPITVAARRRQEAQRPVERYDADATLARVAENYRRLAAGPARWGPVVTIDAAASVEDVGAAIASVVDGLIDGLGAGS